MSEPGATARLRDAIVDALYPISAYELEDVCVGLGLPGPDEGESAFASKRAYVRRRLFGWQLADLADLARRVIDEYGAEELIAAMSQLGPSGPDGSLKNLIFAADGPKPRIVLRDAINHNRDRRKRRALSCLRPTTARPRADMGGAVRLVGVDYPSPSRQRRRTRPVRPPTRCAERGQPW